MFSEVKAKEEEGLFIAGFIRPLLNAYHMSEWMITAGGNKDVTEILCLQLISSLDFLASFRKLGSQSLGWIWEQR